MRVLFIHNYYQQRGGEDAVFEEEVKLLKEQGHQVDTVVFNNDGFTGSVMGNLTGALTSLYNRRSATRVEEAIDSFKPDIIHIHNLFYTASPSVIMAAKRKGVPVVMTLHNYRLVCNSGNLSREVETQCERCLKKTIPLSGIKYGCFRESRLQTAQLTAITSIHKLTGLWQNIDQFIVLTDFAREKILESSLKLSREQVSVKPNFVRDLGFVDLAERQNFFLYIGRLHYEKGVQYLIKAAYAHNHPIEIIGDGPLRGLVEKAAQDLPHVTYHGFLPRAEGIKKMQTCRAMIVPSIWYEGLPTTILEAFSTGTPVLCSNQDNLNQIVRHRDTGILFDPNQIESLLTVMDEASTNNSLLKDITRNARNEYEKVYDPQQVINRLIKIYQSLCTRPVVRI